MTPTLSIVVLYIITVWIRASQMSHFSTEKIRFYTLTRIPIYKICETASKNRNVIRLRRCAGFTVPTLEDVWLASGRTTERRERSYMVKQNG
jgi:hypothetical protein